MLDAEELTLILDGYKHSVDISKPEENYSNKTS